MTLLINPFVFVRPKPGMVLLKPSSIDYAGTSASIGVNGQVTFTSVTSLSLNGVFSADFDNYVLVIRHNSAADNPDVNCRWRASGTDASGSDYAYQFLVADNTSLIVSRATSQSSTRMFSSSSTSRSGHAIYMYGPHLTQPTATRGVSTYGESNARIYDLATTHSLSTSYDGWSISSLSSSSLTGALQVYGVRS